MSQPRPVQIGQHNETSDTKIFVGGLAWETRRHTMRRYFEQFGEILEAVVITDKNTGRSKGYGFVTFKDPEAAIRACINPSPVIDGRRANCNLAALGGNKPRPHPSPRHGAWRFRPPSTMAAPPSSSQYPFPITPYGYSGYSQDSLYPTSYYSLYGGQNYLAGGIFPNIYPYYAQFAQTSHSHGFGVHYHSSLQFPYLPQQFVYSTVLSLPSATSSAMAAASTGGVVITEVSAGMPTSTAAAATPSGQESDLIPAEAVKLVSKGGKIETEKRITMADSKEGKEKQTPLSSSSSSSSTQISGSEEHLGSIKFKTSC